MNKLFSYQIVLILALINLGVALFTGNISAACGWITAMLGAAHLTSLGE